MCARVVCSVRRQGLEPEPMNKSRESRDILLLIRSTGITASVPSQLLRISAPRFSAPCRLMPPGARTYARQPLSNNAIAGRRFRRRPWRDAYRAQPRVAPHRVWSDQHGLFGTFRVPGTAATRQETASVRIDSRLAWSADCYCTRAGRRVRLRRASRWFVAEICVAHVRADEVRRVEIDSDDMCVGA